MPGAARGRSALLKAWNLEHPSILACCSTSRGSELKKPIRIHVTMGIVRVSWIMTSPAIVPLSPISENRK